MRHIRSGLALAALTTALLALRAPAPVAQTPARGPSIGAMLGEMRWRPIGPFRGGRTKAVTGVPAQPNVFYVGAVNGGVWKTNDFGRTWTPIFDDQPTGSIGAIAVAPSDPNIVYVGSGEGLARPDLSVGDGIYKSTDAGKTWTHLGLRDGQQIPQIIVDPRNAGSTLRRSARASVRSERGARRLSIDRRRPLVPESPVEGREHRRRRPRVRPEESGRRLRMPLGAAAGAVGERRVGRHQWRHFQVDRRRRHVASADARSAGRRHRPGGHRRGAERSEPHLRDGCDGAAGAASSARTTPARAGRGSRPTIVPPAASAAATCRCPSSIRRIQTS